MTNEWQDDGTSLEPSDLESLRAAVEQLEVPGFFARTMEWLGKPVEVGMRALPAGAQEGILAATRKAMEGALAGALKTMDLQTVRPARDGLHKALATVAGGVGGVFGLASLPVELPISTTIMLRSVAAVARAEGEDLREMEARLQCLAVFAMGGRSSGVTDAEGPLYYEERLALASAVAEAATFLANKKVAEKAALASPVVARFVTRVSERFAPEVAEKLAATGVPLIGAASGATVNYLFMDHFQSIAHGHFTVRRLERQYGADRIRAAYDDLWRGMNKLPV